MNKRFITLSFLVFIIFSGISYAGEKSSAVCKLDMDIFTADTESGITAYIGDVISVAVIAQNVNNLDTYQAEIYYAPAVLEFIEGYEDASIAGIKNLLKTNKGKTIGFQAVETEPGIVNIANSLTGTDTSEAPEGSGVIALLKFRVIDNIPETLSLANVYFVDSFQNQNLITDTGDGNIN